MNLCQFKDILGKPNQGFHSNRFFGFALNDILATVVGGLIIAYLTKDRTVTGYSKWIALAFFAGIVFHWVFCVDTAFMRLIFGSIAH